MNHLTDGEWSLRLEGHSHGVKWVLERQASESLQVPNRLEAAQGINAGMKAVE